MAITERGRWANGTLDERGKRVLATGLTERGKMVFGLSTGTNEILYGTAKSTSLASGSLSVGHSLFGSSQSQSNASGSLTTAHPLSGQSKSISTSAGDLTVSHPLKTTAKGQSSTSGILSTTADIVLYATAKSVSQSVGILSIDHPLSGSAIGASTGLGELTNAVPLGAFILSRSASSGILSTVNISQIVERIKLKAERTLKVSLQAQRTLKVTLQANRTLHITLRGGTMTAVNQNFSMYQGEKKEIDFPATEDDGSPINFTGLTVKWVLKKYVTSATVPVTKNSTDGGISLSSGMATVNLVQTDTDNLIPGPYYHELKVVETNSVLTTGTCTINPSGA